MWWNCKLDFVYTKWHIIEYDTPHMFHVYSVVFFLLKVVNNMSSLWVKCTHFHCGKLELVMIAFVLSYTLFYPWANKICLNRKYPYSIIFYICISCFLWFVCPLWGKVVISSVYLRTLVRIIFFRTYQKIKYVT